MNDPVLEQPQKLPRFVLWGGIGAVLLSVIGSYGSGLGLWPFTFGFPIVAAGLALAGITLITAIIAWFKHGRHGRGRGAILIGTLGALGLAAILGNWFWRVSTHPMIHDVTTDLAAPPPFEKLVLRQDNLAGVETEDKWRALHAAAYGDIKPRLVAGSLDAVQAKARTLIASRGWEIALDRPGQIEATATISPFRFKDDVIITFDATGEWTRVGMRSVSRVGISDVGVNADRIRSFLSDLGPSTE
jgi:Protein of unknown function (DUF1499)